MDERVLTPEEKAYMKLPIFMRYAFADAYDEMEELDFLIEIGEDCA